MTRPADGGGGRGKRRKTTLIEGAGTTAPRQAGRPRGLDLAVEVPTLLAGSESRTPTPARSAGPATARGSALPSQEVILAEWLSIHCEYFLG